MELESLKGLTTFGALGIICAYLLWKDYAVGSKERAARHALANSITANNAVTEKLVDKLTDLDRAIWSFILTKGGQTHEPLHDPPGRPPSRPRQQGRGE